MILHVDKRKILHYIIGEILNRQKSKREVIMPIIRKCPKCGFYGNHGFTIEAVGMHYYHKTESNGEGKVVCTYYENDNGIFDTELAAFNSMHPKKSNDKELDTWLKARRADMTGHPKLAKRLFKQWKELVENGG